MAEANEQGREWSEITSEAWKSQTMLVYGHKKKSLFYSYWDEALLKGFKQENGVICVSEKNHSRCVKNGF